jgi:hypothetical protein
MGRFVAGANRSQTALFPECLDDWIVEDNPVRELLDVPIDRRAATPLFRQVYAGLTTAILERRLQQGRCNAFVLDDKDFRHRCGDGLRVAGFGKCRHGTIPRSNWPAAKKSSDMTARPACGKLVPGT